MPTRLVVALLISAAAALPAAAERPAHVELSREGHVFRLQAAFEVKADTSVAWQVLTDYDGMTRFVSSLRKSRVVRREADGPVIEQEGAVRVLIVSRRIPMTLKVVERAPTEIRFTDVGDSAFEEYAGSWTIAESSGISRVSYQLFAEMKPSLVPRGVARRVLEKSVADQLRQVQREMERRAAVSLQRRRS